MDVGNFLHEVAGTRSIKIDWNNFFWQKSYLEVSGQTEAKWSLWKLWKIDAHDFSGFCHEVTVW